jgi:hypothetical protein
LVSRLAASRLTGGLTAVPFAPATAARQSGKNNCQLQNAKCKFPIGNLQLAMLLNFFKKNAGVQN